MENKQIEKIKKSTMYKKMEKYGVWDEHKEEYIKYRLKQPHNPEIIKMIRKFIKKEEFKDLCSRVTFKVEPAKSTVIGGGYTITTKQ